MKVRYANLAFIPRTKPKDKIENYLLSLINPYTKPRAIYFRSKGFTETNTGLFEMLLLKIIRLNDVAGNEQSKYGKKYIVDGKIQTPVGEHISLRTVWIVDIGKRKPKFVTAYPYHV